MKPIILFIALLSVQMAVIAQGYDPNSMPPGAPLRPGMIDPTHAMVKDHPGNAGNKVLSSHFTIVESQSYNSGHSMDQVWYNLLIGMGHTATIVPQTTLNSNAFFGGTNALIVSSGVINLSATAISTIQQFIQSGKSVYLQGEYLSSFNSNQAFASIVNATGGTFTSGSTVAGDLIPTNILNAFATTPNAVASIGYHWYGCTGSGCNNVEYFMRYGASNIGFVYCPTIASYGDIIQSTDQDWVNGSYGLPLMQNIVFALLSGNACSVVCGVLAATEMDLEANLDSEGNVHLDWTLDGEVDYGRFVVSANGEKQAEVGLSEGNGIRFQWQDPRLVAGVQRYEVQLLDENGQVSLSGVAEINVAAPSPTLRAVPTDGGFRLWLTMGHQLTRLEVLDLQGRRVAFVPTSEATQGQFLSMAAMPAGAYWIQGQTAQGQLLQTRVLWMP
jgi:hypothetical protein